MDASVSPFIWRSSWRRHSRRYGRKDEAEIWLATITLVVIVIGVLIVLARLVGVV